MAAKKDKLLESAQKYLAKGQLDRAIGEYRQITELDPADTRNRQKLAELLVRANRKEEAIAEYEAISRQYSGSHFYMKAIAPPGITMTDIYESIVPFVFLQGVGLIIVIIFPEIALWLPHKMAR